MKKMLFKSIGFVLAIHIIGNVCMVLYAESILNDVASLICVLLICVCSAPLYFFIKNDTEHVWMYMAITAISHIFFSIVGLCLIRIWYTNWSFVAFWFLEIFLMIFFICILAMDACYNLLQRKRK